MVRLNSWSAAKYASILSTTVTACFLFQLQHILRAYCHRILHSMNLRYLLSHNPELDYTYEAAVALCNLIDHQRNSTYELNLTKSTNEFTAMKSPYRIVD